MMKTLQRVGLAIGAVVLMATATYAAPPAAEASTGDLEDGWNDYGDEAAGEETGQAKNAGIDNLPEGSGILTPPPAGNTAPPEGNTSPPIGNLIPPNTNTGPPEGNTRPPGTNIFNPPPSDTPRHPDIPWKRQPPRYQQQHIPRVPMYPPGGGKPPGAGKPPSGGKPPYIPTIPGKPPQAQQGGGIPGQGGQPNQAFLRLLYLMWLMRQQNANATPSYNGGPNNVGSSFLH